MKSGELTGGDLQSAFNTFVKFTVKHLWWSLFLIKLQVGWCATLSRKITLAQVFSCKFSKIFKKTYFVEHVRKILEWNKKNGIRTICSQENSGDDFLVRAVVDMWVYSFFKREPITDAFLQKLWSSFTEHYFHKTMMRDFFWFLATFSMFYLLYQW